MNPFPQIRSQLLAKNSCLAKDLQANPPSSTRGSFSQGTPGLDAWTKRFGYQSPWVFPSGTSGAKRGPCSRSKIPLQLISLSKASSANVFMPYLMSHRLQPLSCRACSKAMANWWAKTISVLATAFWHPAMVEGGARIGWQVGPPTVKQSLTAWPPTAKPMVGSLVLILMLHGLLHTSSPSSKSRTGFWDTPIDI